MRRRSSASSRRPRRSFRDGDRDGNGVADFWTQDVAGLGRSTEERLGPVL
jgi:hypothetical protein